MGNAERKLTDYSIAKSYNPDHWTKYYTSGPEELWKNIVNHEKAQVFSLPVVPSIEDMGIYELRSSQPNLVRVLHVGTNNTQYMCGINPRAQLLVQYIPIRLSMVDELDQEEALTVLFTAFKGFHTIEGLLGPFEITEDLIGFNEEGKPKVWLNRQYNLNSSKSQKQALPSQSKRIREIYEMVEQKIRGKQVSDKLKWQLQNTVLNYIRAIDLLEDYAIKEELSLRRYIRTDIIQRQIQTRIYSRHSRQNSTINYLQTDRSDPPNQRSFNSPQHHRLDNYRSLESKYASPIKVENKINFSIKNTNPNVVEPTVNQDSRSIPKITFNHSKSASNLSPPLMGNCKVLNSPKNSYVPLQKISAVNSFSFKAPRIIFSKTSPDNKVQPILIHNQPSNNQLQKVIIANDVEPIPSQKKEQKESCNSVSDNEILMQNKSFIDKVSQEIQKQKQEEVFDEPPEPVPSLTIQSNINNDQDIIFSGGFKQLSKEDLEIRPEEVKNVKENHQKLAFTQQNNFIQNKLIDNFESFGVNPVQIIDNFSFAPQNLPSRVQLNPHTSQSLEMQEIIQQKEEVQSISSNSFERKKSSSFNANEVKLIESSQECIISDNQKQNDLKQSRTTPINFKQYTNSVNSEGSQPQISENKSPFYANYTSVQSKFHIMIKKDSTGQPVVSHSRKVSAFSQLQDQQQKNGFKNRCEEGQMRVNRVSSQYEQFFEKNSEISEPNKTGAKTTSNFGTTRNPVNADIIEGDQQDFLDVKFLEKSLDFKYQHGKRQHKKREDDELLNVANMQEKLSKFSVSQNNISEEPSLSKIKGIERKTQEYKSSSYGANISSYKLENKKIPSIEQYTDNSPYHYKKDSSKQLGSYNNTSSYPKYHYQDNTMEVPNQKNSQPYYGSRKSTNTYSSALKGYQSLQKNPYNNTGLYSTYDSGEYQSNYKSSSRPNFCESKNLLEDRYQKYVKQVQPIGRKKSYDNIPKVVPTKNKFIISEYEIEQEIPTFRKKEQKKKEKISYDELRSILFN